MKYANHYIEYLINEVLRQTEISTDIIKGLAAFDTFIMFRRPKKVALRHFDIFYSTFCLTSWVTKANQSVSRDQYTQLLDHLRVCDGPNFGVTSTYQYLIEFLLGLDFLQSSYVVCALKPQVPLILTTLLVASQQLDTTPGSLTIICLVRGTWLEYLVPRLSVVATLI